MRLADGKGEQGSVQNMTEYKPSIRTQVVYFATFFALVLPAIVLAGEGYFLFLEHGLKIDMNEKSEGIRDSLFMMLMMLPMVPTIVVGILLAGMPWMFFMSRFLSWADIEYYGKQKGPRFPWLSDWLERIWERMLESKRKASPTSGSDQ